MGKVLLIACTNVGRAMIDAIMTSDKLKDVELAGVVNLSPEAAIGKANYDSYIDLFVKYEIPYFYCRNVNDPECVEFMKSKAPDIIIQSGWSQKFKEEVLAIPRYACIGEHPAPLPKGRGAACVNWAIITGEKEWGDTFFHMEMQYDTGLVYSQEYFTIEQQDDVKTVYDKVAAAAVRSIEKHLADWTEGRLEGKKQDDAASTHFPRRRPSDGLFDFKDKPAQEIYNHIRGQARPYPGAFFMKGEGENAKKVYVWKARMGDGLLPGEYAVACGDGKNVILQRVQEEGRAEVWADEYFAEAGKRS